MELAAEIRAMNSAAALIFVSSHSDFVFESFQFQPFRFLRKEWLAEELPDAVKAYCENYAKSGQTARLVLDDKRIVTKKLVEVVYFFSIRHHIYLVTLEETAELSAREYTLEKLEEQFSRSGFLRIHKSYLLNYRYVYHIGAGKFLRKNGGSCNFLYVVLFYQPSGFNSSQFAFRVCTSGNRKYFKSTVKSCIRNFYYQAALLCVNASDFAGSEKRGLSFQDK